MTKREKELKELFQDLAKQADDYYELESYLDGYMDCGTISNEEYDVIIKHWDEWLPEEN